MKETFWSLLFWRRFHAYPERALTDWLQLKQGSLKLDADSSRYVKAMFAVPLGLSRCRGESAPKDHVQLSRLYEQARLYIFRQDDAETDDFPWTVLPKIHAFSGH